MDETLTQPDVEDSTATDLDEAGPDRSTSRSPWARARPDTRAFFGWAAGIYAAVTAVILAFSLRISEGTLIYALDDPAIHHSIARTLAQDGT